MRDSFCAGCVCPVIRIRRVRTASRHRVFATDPSPLGVSSSLDPAPPRSPHPCDLATRRAAFSFLAFLLTVVLVASSPTSDALAQQRKGGQKEGRAKEKDVPPPNLTVPDPWVKAFTWRYIGPANMGGRITAISVFEADPTTYWVATASGGLLKTTNNGITFEHQFDQRGHRLHRRRVRRPVEPEHRLGRHRREQPAELRLLRRRRLQVDRRRQDLEEHGAQEDLPDRQDRDPPEEPGHRLRRRAGPAVRPERGARPVQDDRRRQDLEEGPLRRRQDRRHRHARCTRPTPRRCSSPPGSGSATGSTRGPAAALPDGYDAYDPVKKWGPGSGHLQDDRRRQDVQEADQGPADDAHRAASAWTIYRKDPNVVFAIIDCEKIGMGVRPRRRPSPATAYMGIQR